MLHGGLKGTFTFARLRALRAPRGAMRIRCFSAPLPQTFAPMARTGAGPRDREAVVARGTLAPLDPSLTPRGRGSRATESAFGVRRPHGGIGWCRVAEASDLTAFVALRQGEVAAGGAPGAHLAASDSNAPQGGG